MMMISIRYNYPGAPSSISRLISTHGPHGMNREFFSGGCFLRFTFFYSSEYKTNLLILRISFISCYHSCLLCKRIWRLIYYANCQLNCCDQICDLQTITCRYEENYRYLILPLRITLHQITNSFPHCGLATLPFGNRGLVGWFLYYQPTNPLLPKGLATFLVYDN